MRRNRRMVVPNGRNARLQFAMRGAAARTRSGIPYFDGGLVQDGGFIYGLDEWVPISYGEGATGISTGAAAALSTPAPVLKFQWASGMAAARGVKQDIAVLPGVPYDYAFSVINGASGDMRVNFIGNVAGNLAQIDHLLATQLDATGSFTTGASDTSVQIEIRTRATANPFDSEVDQVYLQLSAPVAAGAIPTQNLTVGVAITPIDVIGDFTGGALTVVLTSGTLVPGLTFDGQQITGTPTEVGSLRSLVFTATNAGGADTTSFDMDASLALAAPVNTVLPVISGTPEIGQTLSVTDGTWTGNPTPTFTYQWRRDTVPIGGATASTYLLVAGDDQTDVDCVVTATNSEAAVPATAASVAVTYPAPVAAGGLPDQSFTENTGVHVVPTASDFTNAVGGAFSLATVTTGITINPATADVSVDTDATGLLSLSSVIVRYTNSGGQDDSGFSQSVIEAGGSAPTVDSDLPNVTATVGQALTPIDALSVTTGATGATRLAPATIPPGTSYSALGVLTGTPTERGAWVISQRATNGAGPSPLYSYVLEVEPALTETVVENPTLSYNACEHNYFSPEDAFLNKAKMGSPWSGQRPALPELNYGDLLTAGVINATGYPFTVGATGVDEFNSYFAWGDFQAGPAFAGDYIVKWDVLSGDGGAIRLTEAAAGYASAGTRRLTFTYAGSGNWGLFVDPATGFPTNIRICRAEHEDLLDAGGIWNPDFLAIMHNVRELRFLDWMHTNSSTWSDYAADRTLVDAYTYGAGNGGEVTVPVEIMCDLCNSTTTEPWFTIPHLFTDASITAFATAVRDNLDPSLRARFEWSNEVWNSGFAQFSYALAQSNADWGPGTNDAIGWQTKRAVEMAQLINAVFVGETSRVVHVLGGFNAIPFNTGQMLSAAGWFANEPGDDIPANDPMLVFDEFAITTYFGASGDIINAGLSAAIASGYDEGAEYLYASLLNGANETSIPDTLGLIDQHLTEITNLGGGVKLSLYEGGQHVHFSSGITSPANDAFFLAFCQGDHMADLYQRIYEGLEARNVGPFMQFTILGNSSQFGTWGLRQSLTDTTPRRLAYVEATARQKTQWWTDARPTGTFTGGAAVVRNLSVHGDMHSIWSHDDQYSNVSVWLHRMQLQEPDLDFYMGGFFLAGQDYSAPPPFGQHVYNGTKPNAYEVGATATWPAFDAAGIDGYGYSPSNFDDSGTAEDFHFGNFSTRVGAVVANTTTPPRFFMYRPWDDYAWYLNAGNGGSGTAFPGTTQDFLDWRDNYSTRRPAMTTMLDNVLSRTQAAHPTADIFQVNVNEMLKRVLANTALQSLGAADLFRDGAPHGFDVIYLVAAMIAHSTIYNRPCPIDMDLTGATLPSQFTNNIEDIRDYIWAEVVTAAQTPPGGENLPVLGTATFNASGAMSAIGTLAQTGTATFNASGALAASATGELTGTATFNGSGALSANGTLMQTGAAAFNGSGLLAANGTLPAADPPLVVFDGVADEIGNIASFGTAVSAFTFAMRFRPDATLDGMMQIMSQTFNLFMATAENLGFYIPAASDWNTNGALVDGGGSPTGIEFSILAVADNAGIGGGADTARLYIDGRLIGSTTTAFTAPTISVAGCRLFGAFGGGNMPVSVRRVWIATTGALPTWSDHFEGDNTVVPLSGEGVIGGITPAFWQEGDADQWNSGSDAKTTSTTYSMIGGGVTDA